MPDRPQTRVTLIAGTPRGVYDQIVPLLNTLDAHDQVAVTIAITPPAATPRVIDQRGAPSKPGPA